MNQKFSIGDFIFDCFICLFLMIISYIIFFIPTLFLLTPISLLLPSNFHILNGFGDWALLFTLCHILLFITWFYFLEKKNIIKYRMCKSSFWCVFILFTAFWWYFAYVLANTPK